MLLVKAMRGAVLLWTGVLSAPMGCAALLVEAVGNIACMLNPAAAILLSEFEALKNFREMAELRPSLSLPCWS